MTYDKALMSGGFVRRIVLASAKRSRSSSGILPIHPAAIGAARIPVALKFGHVGTDWVANNKPNGSRLLPAARAHDLAGAIFPIPLEPNFRSRLFTVHGR